MNSGGYTWRDWRKIEGYTWMNWRNTGGYTWRDWSNPGGFTWRDWRHIEGYTWMKGIGRFWRLYLKWLLAINVEPVCADKMLLVEDGVVRAQEVEVLELKENVRFYQTRTFKIKFVVLGRYIYIKIHIYRCICYRKTCMSTHTMEYFFQVLEQALRATTVRYY